MGRMNAPMLAPGVTLGRSRHQTPAARPSPRGNDNATDAAWTGDAPDQPGAGDVAAVAATAPTRWRPLMLADMLVPEKNSFGVVRLLAALAVLISHAVWLSGGHHDMEPLYRWTGYTLGQHGVQVFFVLSGILVAQSLYRSMSVRDYAIARTLRILPALIVCVLATALLLGPALTVLKPVTYLKDAGVAAYIVKTILLATGSAPLPGLFAEVPVAGLVNTSLWTLKYEVLCYVLLAGIGAIAIWTRAWRAVAAAGLAIWLVAVLIQPVGVTLGSTNTGLETLRYFALFFGTGVAAFVLRAWLPVHGLVLAPLGLLFVAAIGTRFTEPAAALFLGYGAIWVASLDLGRLRTYTNANDYSYGTYIYAMPVTQAVLLLWPGAGIVALVTMTMGLVLMLAFLSWELVERPALQWRHALVAKAGSAAPDVVADAPPPALTRSIPVGETGTAAAAFRSRNSVTPRTSRRIVVAGNAAALTAGAVATEVRAEVAPGRIALAVRRKPEPKAEPVVAGFAQQSAC